MKRRRNKKRAKAAAAVAAVLIVIAAGAGVYLARPDLVRKAAPRAVREQERDVGLVKSYVREHYGVGMEVRFREKPSYNEITNRKGTALVEVVRSRSEGRRGRLADGTLIKYNKKVKKGKRVTSYLIWNPRNDFDDDIAAVVDNGKVR